MKLKFYSSALGLAIWILFSPFGARGPEALALSVKAASSPRSTAAIRIALEINRNLIAELSEKYQRLHAEQVRRFSERNEKLMHDIELEIVALNSDGVRLEHALAQSLQAEEMLKGLIAQKLARIRTQALPRTPEAQRDRAYQLHERALSEVSAGRLENAVSIYEELILANPSDDEAYLIMGHCELMLGRYEKAERAFHNAVDIDASNIRDITPFYENRILRDPNDDAAYSDLGYAWLMLGDYASAKRAFQNALSIDPDNAAAINGMEIVRTGG